MKAILIAPDLEGEARVSEIDWSGHFKGPDGAYAKLSSPAKAVSCIDLKQVAHGLTLLFDDEGGLVDGNPVFELPLSRPLGGSQIIAGRALLVGDAQVLCEKHRAAHHLTEDDDFCDLRLINAVPPRELFRVLGFPAKVTTGGFGAGRDMTPEELKQVAAAHGGLEFQAGYVGGAIELRDVEGEAHG